MTSGTPKQQFRLSNDGRTLDFRISSRPKVENGWLDTIGDVTAIENLYFGSAHISEANFAQVSKLTNLRVLVLRSRHCSDCWIEHLSPLKELQELDLSNCRIGDKSILNLMKFMKLRVLRIRNTKITIEGRRQLQSASGDKLKIIG